MKRLISMKGYTSNFDKELCASTRVEGVDASYKDLSQVCGVIRGKETSWARTFLERAAKGEIPVLYRKHNKRLGHRRELGGKKGRYPKKSAGIVLKALNAAIANGVVKGLGDEYEIIVATANKKDIYPRMASKGRTARAYLVTSRIELVLKTKNEVPKEVEVVLPAKKEAKEEKPKSTEKKAEADSKIPPVPKHPEHVEHKHEIEKGLEAAHSGRNDKTVVEHNKGKRK
jgi:large subunit ribosomal protein L22